MRKGRKSTGGKYKKARKSRLYEKDGHERLAHLGEERKKSIRTRGGHYKKVLLATNKVNLLDKKTNKYEVVKIKSVLETPSNKYLARRGILTKGTIIETEKGKARVTNRPSQEAHVQAVKIE